MPGLPSGLLRRKPSFGTAFECGDELGTSPWAAGALMRFDRSFGERVDIACLEPPSPRPLTCAPALDQGQSLARLTSFASIG